MNDTIRKGIIEGPPEFVALVGFIMQLTTQVRTIPLEARIIDHTNGKVLRTFSGKDAVEFLSVSGRLEGVSGRLEDTIEDPCACEKCIANWAQA